MARVTLLLVAVAGCFVACEGVSANPIRKVVNMLKDMQKNIAEEGEKEKGLFEAFMCQCKSGAASLEESIKTGTAQVESLTGTLESESAEKSQVEQDIVQHKSDIAAAEATLKESTAMRGKEAAEFSASSGEMKANIEAMTGALAALKKGLSASMLQTSTGQLLRSIVEHSPVVSETERGTLLGFLETGEGGSDQIVGIVETMKETMEADLKESTEEEESAKASFKELVGSKQAEISAAQKAVEGKTARSGELAVSLVQSEADLENTKTALEDDTTMKANLAKSCATKSTEFDERSKTRAMELQAVSETVEMLSGDEALELFKKTLPSAPALVQVSASSRIKAHLRSKMHLKMRARSRASRPRFLMLQTRNGQGLKNAVQDVIGKLIASNTKKQADDDAQKEFCIKELAAAEEQTKALEAEVGDLEADIPRRADVIATLESEIQALQQGLADLDKSVAEATEQRKAEHKEFLDTSAANSAALELIGMAKNRMQKFYAPEKYVETTTSSSVYGLVQYRKDEGASGVIGMMDSIMHDIEMEMSEAKHEEKSAQKDYEVAMKDAVTKRPADSRMIVEKTEQKATESTNLESVKTTERATKKLLAEAKQKAQYTHGMCDTFLKNYEAKKASRASENESLKENQGVLGDVEPVFIQGH